MSRLQQAIRRYVGERAGGVGEPEANQVLRRAAARWRRGRSMRRQVLNATAALSLVLLLTVGVVAIQLRSTQTSPPPAGAQLPDEVVDFVGSADQLTPFRVREHRLLPPQPSLVVANDSQLKIAYRVQSSNVGAWPSCVNTTIRVTDPSTGQELRPAVTLPGCYDRYPVPDFVRYDWGADLIVQASKEVMAPVDLLASRDGRWLYAIPYRKDTDSSSGYTRYAMEKLYFVDLQSNSIKAALPLKAILDEPTVGSMVLSPDGRTLYLNQTTGLAIFDTQNFSLRSVLRFESSAAAPQGSGPWWPHILLSAEAKGILGAPGIAADPRGRWLAALGSPEDPKIGVTGAASGLLKGIWLVDLQGTPHVLQQLHPKENFRAEAASLDGSLLYALEGNVSESLLVIDAASGRDLGKFGVCTVKLYLSTSCRDFQGIAGVRPAS